MLRYLVILIPTFIHPASQQAKLPKIKLTQKYRRTWPGQKNSPRPHVESVAELALRQKKAWLEEQRKKGCYCIKTEQGWSSGCAPATCCVIL